MLLQTGTRAMNGPFAESLVFDKNGRAKVGARAAGPKSGLERPGQSQD